jgi:AcrR family transcriptional regulator
MSVVTALPPIFGTPVSLPRGPHGLTRDAVALVQGGRLLDGVTRVVAERGYAATTVAEIARRAAVSPNVFYEHFGGKEDCYLAAYDVFAQTLLERIAGEITPTTEWQDFVVAALGAYLGTLDAEPLVARAFLLEMDGAGPRARQRRHAAYAAIAAVLQQRHKELCERDPSLSPLPQLAYMGIVHGVRELACDVLDGRIEGPVTGLTDGILAWITATFQGAGATA